jgi:subtilisin family serine protease
MATPHVSGIAALIWAANPSWTAAEVKRRLIVSSSPIAALRKKTVSNGRVNAFNALHGIETPSDEPSESAWKSMSFEFETAHPYEGGKEITKEISVPGAKYIRIIFEKFETEARYDTVSLENGAGEVVEVMSGTRSDGYVTDYLKGNKAILRMKTDLSQNGYGFKISKIQFIE